MHSSPIWLSLWKFLSGLIGPARHLVSGHRNAQQRLFKTCWREASLELALPSPIPKISDTRSYWFAFLHLECFLVMRITTSWCPFPLSVGKESQLTSYYNNIFLLRDRYFKGGAMGQGFLFCLHNRAKWAISHNRRSRGRRRWPHRQRRLPIPAPRSRWGRGHTFNKCTFMMKFI